MTLRGLPLVLRAALHDGLTFDPFSAQQHGLTDEGGRRAAAV
jgi:hypothetical protein